MTRQELYSWSSLASSAILLIFYLVAVFGWPAAVEQYSDYVLGLFWKVLAIAVAIEIGLELMRELNISSGDESQEEKLIEAKGYRNAYYFLVGTIALVAVGLFLSDITGQMTGQEVFLSVPFAILHILITVIFLASITKSATNLYYYRKLKMGYS